MTGAFQANGIVTLTTDFGIDDAYVPIMKGVILSIAPQARLIDYTHGIKPGNVVEAAYLIHSGYPYFPRGTVHVVVVDPGVGSDRRAIACQTPDATFVGPDNGVFSFVVEDARSMFGDATQIIELTEREYWLPQISDTFHGRDIFSPVAAHLVRGISLTQLGSPIDTLVPANCTLPYTNGDGILIGQIVHVDRFGNCITNITRDHLDEYGIGSQLQIDIIDQHITGLVRTYTDGPAGTPMCLIGSSGHLEIAVCNGHAAKYLGVDIGDRFRVRAAAKNRVVG